MVPGVSLRYGHNKSCGCGLRERLARGSLRHGLSGTPAWRAWQNMKSRCYNKNSDRWKNYGGRGVAVCPQWIDSFETFLADMGTPPEGFTLERRDVNRDYEPENCEWIPPDKQYSNTTRTVMVSFHGVEYALRDLVAASGVKYATAYSRIRNYGWPAERAFPSLLPESLKRYTQIRPESLHR